MSLCNSHDYERLYFQKSIIENCFIEPYYLNKLFVIVIVIYIYNDNDNELFIQTKSNEKHHKGNINNTYKNINITTSVPRRLHLKTSWPLAYVAIAFSTIAITHLLL